MLLKVQGACQQQKTVKTFSLENGRKDFLKISLKYLILSLSSPDGGMIGTNMNISDESGTHKNVPASSDMGLRVAFAYRKIFESRVCI